MNQLLLLNVISNAMETIIISSILRQIQKGHWRSCCFIRNLSFWRFLISFPQNDFCLFMSKFLSYLKSVFDTCCKIHVIEYEFKHIISFHFHPMWFLWFSNCNIIKQLIETVKCKTKFIWNTFYGDSLAWN